MASHREERQVTVLVFMILCCVSAFTLTAAWTKEDTTGAAGKYNANHAPEVRPHDVTSQLHQDVEQALRAAQYNAFVALLDNMTHSVIRQGITIFAPNDGALSDFKNRMTKERLQDVVRFHVITPAMPFSNLLRLDVGSKLKTDMSNFTITVTNTTAGAYEVDDALIIDPDMYTTATIAVHGVNAVFNTSKFFEEQPINEEPEDGGMPGGFRFRPRATGCAFKIPIEAIRGIPVLQIFLSIAVVFTVAV